MKKCIAVLLCVCALAVTAFAVDSEPDYIAEYEAQYGKMPVSADYSSTEEYQAAYDVWFAGFAPYVNMRYAEWSRRDAAVEETAQSTAETEPPETSPKTVESVGSSYENDIPIPVSSSPVDKYPVGSYVSPAGNVYSSDGELLSPGTTPAYAPISGPDEDAAFLSGELADPNNLSAAADPDALAVIAGLVSDIATDPPVWYVDDLRSSDPPAEVLTGLKSMVTSIFGEYTPVTTTSVISETVGNDTHQYLVETVAPGAAGVDYEWIAGVVLFAIMLYCLMKLLGGVLK